MNVGGVPVHERPVVSITLIDAVRMPFYEQLAVVRVRIERERSSRQRFIVVSDDISTTGHR